MPEPIPALILSNIRCLAHDAQRHGARFAPVTILAINEGKKA